MIFLSCGAGVQSSVMLLRAIHGDIDRPDHVIFSDTGWEPEQVYIQVDWLKAETEKVGIPFHVVTGGNIRDDMVRSRNSASGEYAGRWAAMPLYTRGETDGMIRRQCTSEYKLIPLRKKQRELLGYEKGQRIPVGTAQVMIGISTDEARRASQSTDRWVDNVYPLIDPLKMSRDDCLAWLAEYYPNMLVAKSSCIGCPFRNNKAWHRMKIDRPEEFEDACLFDEQIRDAAGMVAKSFVHSARIPLKEVPLNEDQMDMFEEEFLCSGGCGL